MGIAFLLVSMALAFSAMGRGWWFWMLIPAFSLMGTGVAQYIRVKEEEKRAMIARRASSAFSARDAASSSRQFISQAQHRRTCAASQCD